MPPPPASGTGRVGRGDRAPFLDSRHQTRRFSAYPPALPELNFSERVLVPAAAHLGVVRVKGVEWSDWGNPERVFATLRRTAWHPPWLDRLPQATAGG